LVLSKGAIRSGSAAAEYAITGFQVGYLLTNAAKDAAEIITRCVELNRKDRLHVSGDDLQIRVAVGGLDASLLCSKQPLDAQ
jgi:hypothetical protein